MFPNYIIITIRIKMIMIVIRLTMIIIIIKMKMMIFIIIITTPLTIYYVIVVAEGFQASLVKFFCL